MSSSQHPSPAVTVRSAQDRILIGWVVQEDANMIKAKLFTDYLGNLGQGLLEVFGCADRSRYTSDALKLPCPTDGNLLLLLQLERTIRNTLFQR